jgi:ribosomal protein L7Ae-like RNA K-turn-binding protein
VNEIPVEFTDTRKQLGTACKIDVPAAVAAIIG